MTATTSARRPCDNGSLHPHDPATHLRLAALSSGLEAACQQLGLGGGGPLADFVGLGSGTGQRPRQGLAATLGACQPPFGGLELKRSGGGGGGAMVLSTRFF